MCLLGCFFLKLLTLISHMGTSNSAVGRPTPDLRMWLDKDQAWPWPRRVGSNKHSDLEFIIRFAEEPFSGTTPRGTSGHPWRKQFFQIWGTSSLFNFEQMWMCHYNSALSLFSLRPTIVEVDNSLLEEESNTKQPLSTSV